ncbi:MAG: autotransporter domain-containing protein [Planctomycetia bacterium]|nr:autotransporter domain-containing protein [Planctomycetia bacterium]
MLTIRKIGRRFPTLTAAVFFAVCFGWSAAADAQYVVTSATDNGLGNTAGTLSNAILQANATGGTITFNLLPAANNTVTLTGSMYGITANVGAITIDGGGVTIDGQGQYQAFVVNSSINIVNFKNLTINRGLAQGGAGGNGNGGGGGGLGGGGAIYVDQQATAGIGIQNVNFTNNVAAGGAGGSANGTANGGAGGNFNQNNTNASATHNTSPAGTGGGAGAISTGNGTAGGYGGGGGGGSTGANTVATGNGGGSGGLSNHGGNGGNGLGGALFIGNGSTVTIQGGTVFAANNTATGGAAGAGTTTANNGTAGPGLGGAIYIGTFNPNPINLSTAVFDTSGADISVLGDIYSNGNVRVEGGNAVVNFLGTTFMSTAGTTTVTNGTLNGTTASIVGTVINNSHVSFTQTGLGAFNGALSGSGDVTLLGSGTVVYTSGSTFTYTGDTNVNNGTLVLDTTIASTDINVGPSGTLIIGNAVPVNLDITGIFDPFANGIGTTTVANNVTFRPGSQTFITINSTGNTQGVNNDVINTNNTNILGGTVKVQTSGGVYNPGTQYIFLNSVMPITTMGFTGATTDSAFLGADLFYLTNSVGFTLTRNATTYESAAVTANQQQVAAYLDANSANAMGDFGTVLNNLNTLSTSGAQTAFDQMSGAIYGTAGRMGIQQTSLMYLMLRRGARGNEEIGTEEVHADGRIAGEGSAGDESIQLVNFTDDQRPKLVPVLRVRKQRRHIWNAWSTSYGTLTNDIGNGVNAAAGRFGSFGTLTSAYRYLDDGLKVGVFGAYNHLNLRLTAPLQSANSDDYQLGSYLRGDDGTSYFLAASSIGYDNYQSHRNISFAQINRQAVGDYDGMQTTGYFEIGRKQQMWPFDLEPFVALQYTYLRQNSFVESGADSINLAIPGIDSNSLRSLLGSRAAIDIITLAGAPLKGEFLFAWMHENLGANTQIRSTFAGVGGATFATDGVNFGRNWTVLGAGLTWAPSENTALAANYDALLNPETTFHLVSGSFQYRW